MNFKSSAIAVAVAGSLVAPMAAQADVYASARIGLINTDVDGGDSELQVSSLGSRFGAKGETDLGNGMTGFGKYEWDVDFRDQNNTQAGEAGNTTVGEVSFDDTLTASRGAGLDDDGITIRHRVVGVKGDFGSISLGQTYHTFYNFVVGPNDNPWWGSGYAMVAYVGRTDHALTYAGGSGGVNFGATVYMSPDAANGGEETLDGTELGVSFGIGDMTLGLATRSIEDVDNDVVGVALTGISAGSASIGVGFQANDDDTSFLIDAGFGSLYVHYEMLSLDAADADPTMLTIGYTKGLGPKTTTWYEFQSNDKDDTGADSTVIRAMLKYDIL